MVNIENFICVKFSLFSYPLILTYGFGAQKNRLIETVLLSTYNICFGLEIKKIIFQYALLSGGLVNQYLCSFRYRDCITVNLPFLYIRMLHL